MTTQPCISPSTGTLSPDLRVFYQYGMVLGLNDFLQEQMHNLGLDYHHERALHGYGTVYGLHVCASRPSDNPDDVMLTVEPGMAVDQWGREVTVPSAQCARLGAWLAAQEEAAAGTVEGNLGISGELTVYVVAAYAECADDLVPLPGQPCSSSAQASVPSRLRDAWDIELSWAPPAMPAWDVVRQLAGLLNSIEVVPGLDPSQSSEQDITDAIRALPSLQAPSDFPSGPSDLPSGPSDPSGPAGYQLPAATAGEAFDRIFTVWVTQVRPQLPPDLTAPDPSWDPSILLSTITFFPALPFSAANPVITSYSEPDDTGRPYLLQTELIQELRLDGQAGAVIAPLVQEAVTLAGTADTSGVPTLTAWFHLGEPVSLSPGSFSVVDENGTPWPFSPSTPSGDAFSDVWTLSAQPGSSGPLTVADGALLAATFSGAAVMVGDSSAATLAQAVAGLSLLNTSATGDVTAYAAVSVPTAVPASMPFVTVSYVSVLGAEAYLELWFHLQPSGTTEDVVIPPQLPPSVQVWNDQDRARIFPPPVGPILEPQWRNGVWAIPATNFKPPVYLRLIVDTGQTRVLTPDVPAPPGVALADWITTSGLRYIGWEDNTIVAFARIGTAGEVLGG